MNNCTVTQFDSLDIMAHLYNFLGFGNLIALASMQNYINAVADENLLVQNQIYQ